MPIRLDCVNEQMSESGRSYSNETTRVMEAKQIDGVWIPTSVVRRSGTSVSEWETEIAYEITKFERGTVADKDLEVSFPPGTEVVDLVARIAYRVLPNGGHEMLPLYDADAGEIIDPRPTSVNEAVKMAPEDKDPRLDGQD